MRKRLDYNPIAPTDINALRRVYGDVMPRPGRRLKAVGSMPCIAWNACEKLLRLVNPTILATSATGRVVVASNSAAFRSRTSFNMLIGGCPNAFMNWAANA